MATLIEQKPYYNTLPVGQDVIFTVSNTSVVSTFTRVKFIAEVHISSTFAPNPSATTDIVGTFKTTPNNAGVGMFDFRPIIESFVKADNLARKDSAYKLTVNTEGTNVPIHLIDKFSGNLNSMRYLAIQFKVEYINTAGNLITTGVVNSDLYNIFNGYLKYTDAMDLVGVDFGYNISNFNLSNTSDSFLSNAPITQYANLEDYGTVALLSPNNDLDYIKLIYKDSANVQIGQNHITKNLLNGAYNSYNGSIGMNLLFFGCFPANLQNWSITFNALVSAGTIEGGSIVVQAFSTTQAISKEYIINVNCPTLKGYEPKRLCWLNQWGAWDYYTFTMKSSKMISTKGSTYQQIEGSWNESAYKINGFKGGKKAFRVNATEKITMNTDFVNESESEWFEELINSPEVYILEGFKDETATPNTALNTYVTPVRLTTSSYTKKTVANDKIMQYTFEVEKSKTLRTQAV
jgi:hypothetical protein